MRAPPSSDAGRWSRLGLYLQPQQCPQGGPWTKQYSAQNGQPQVHERTAQTVDGEAGAESKDKPGFRGLDSKYLPPFPIPQFAGWQHRMDEILGFRGWLETAAAWLVLFHPSFPAELRFAVQSNQQINERGLDSHQVGRSLLMKQLFAQCPRVQSQMAPSAESS